MLRLGIQAKGTSFTRHNAGFTLIELLVSVAIFSVVVVIALGALLSMAEADRKAQALKTIINNLNFSIDSMSRTIRTGVDYHCGTPSGGDCTSGINTYLSVTASNGQKVAFCLDGTTLKREVTSGTPQVLCSHANFLTLTAAEVVIERLQFYVLGSPRIDTFQPRVTILLSGYVLLNNGEQTPFEIQTTVTQRLYDT